VRLNLLILHHRGSLSVLVPGPNSAPFLQASASPASHRSLCLVLNVAGDPDAPPSAFCLLCSRASSHIIFPPASALSSPRLLLSACSDRLQRLRLSLHLCCRLGSSSCCCRVPITGRQSRIQSLTPGTATKEQRVQAVIPCDAALLLVLQGQTVSSANTMAVYTVARPAQIATETAIKVAKSPVASLIHYRSTDLLLAFRHPKILTTS
jgi:hypothetical protein